MEEKKLIDTIVHLKTTISKHGGNFSESEPKLLTYEATVTRIHADGMS